ncbi:MAG: hypothetical protein ABIU11_02835, partial [Chitinophagaceae bacterium]
MPVKLPTQKTYTADRIFTGEKWLTNTAVIVKEGMINDIVPVSSIPATQQVQQFGKCIIAPAFI